MILTKHEFAITNELNNMLLSVINTACLPWTSSISVTLTDGWSLTCWPERWFLSSLMGMNSYLSWDIHQVSLFNVPNLMFFPLLVYFCVYLWLYGQQIDRKFLKKKVVAYNRNPNPGKTMEIPFNCVNGLLFPRWQLFSCWISWQLHLHLQCDRERSALHTLWEV